MPSQSIDNPYVAIASFRETMIKKTHNFDTTSTTKIIPTQLRLLASVTTGATAVMNDDTELGFIKPVTLF